MTPIFKCGHSKTPENIVVKRRISPSINLSEKICKTCRDAQRAKYNERYRSAISEHERQLLKNVVGV